MAEHSRLLRMVGSFFFVGPLLVRSAIAILRVVRSTRLQSSDNVMLVELTILKDGYSVHFDPFTTAL
jgi:hypothetical protein